MRRGATLRGGVAGDNARGPCSAARMRRVPLAFVAAMGLAIAGHAADRPGAPTPPAPPPDASLAAARDALIVAQDALRAAGGGKAVVYGDHRKLALELVNTALQQVDTSLRLAAEEVAKREREAAKKRPAGKRRRR